MNDVEGLQQQVENVSKRLDAALHKLAEYQRVVAGAVRDGVYRNNDHWWHELCRLEREQSGGLTKRAADECQSHAWNASHTGFKFCPDCGDPLSTHR